MSDTLILNEKVCSKSNRTQQQKYMCITNWGKLVLQTGAASLLQIGASVVTNWTSYYKMGQNLLQIGIYIYIYIYIIINLQKSDMGRILLTISVNFISSKDVNEECVMHSKSSNI